jgi:hypothetical protein
MYLVIEFIYILSIENNIILFSIYYQQYCLKAEDGLRINRGFWGTSSSQFVLRLISCIILLYTKLQS